MNHIPDHDTGSRRGPRRRSQLRSAGVLAAAAAAVTLLATACGGGSSTAAAPATATPATLTTPAAVITATPATTATPAAVTTATAAPGTYQAALAYAQCMRAHGAASWPDPGSDGYFTGNIDLSRAQYLSANAACGRLLPDGGVLSHAQIQQSLSALSKYAACMRSHGIAGFPNPDPQVVEAGYTWAGYVSPGTLHTTAQQFNSAGGMKRGRKALLALVLPR